jgi:hypothetical protein
MPIANVDTGSAIPRTTDPRVIALDVSCNADGLMRRFEERQAAAQSAPPVVAPAAVTMKRRDRRSVTEVVN